MADFDHVWRRIEQHSGEEFRLKHGRVFTYDVSGLTLRPSTTNRNLPRRQFQRAAERAPLTGPGQLRDLQGPSYLFAILTDDRIAHQPQEL